VNLSLAVFDKSGNLLMGPLDGNMIWQSLGGVCATANSGDPIALYDQPANRWLLSQFALPNGLRGPFYQCVAVSQTGDPTGAYHLYAYKVSDTKLNDYPKFGVWPDGYYMAINMFQCFIFCSWAGQGAIVFERDKMLAGQPARGLAFDLYAYDPNLGAMLPSDLDGSTPPPLGTPNYFVLMDDDAWNYSPDQLQIWEFAVTWGASPTATFTPGAALPTAAFDSYMCGGERSCIPQPGTGVGLDAIADRLMYRLQYRNFGTYQTLMTNHTVDVGGDHAGIRWYEIRDPGGAPFIHQQGTYAPDADHRWMGSIAMDALGNIALGFSVGGSGTYPSIRYTGRAAGTNAPLGVMSEAETELIAGGGSQTHTASRWGDYSTMSVDPTDGCTFWYTQEYYATTSSADWRTRIGSFRFPSCDGGGGGTDADLALAMTDAPDPVAPGGTLTYTITVTNSGPGDANSLEVADSLPAGATFQSASGEGWACSWTTTTVTCKRAALAFGAASAITIAVTAPAAGGSITNTATVSAAPADPAPGNNTVATATTVQATQLTLVKPNGGESWKSKSNQTIQWTSTQVSGPMKIELSRDGGLTWVDLFANTPNDGAQSWKVTGPATTQALVRISSVNPPAVSDVSNGVFTIR